MLLFNDPVDVINFICLFVSNSTTDRLLNNKARSILYNCSYGRIIQQAEQSFLEHQKECKFRAHHSMTVLLGQITKV